MIGRRLLTLVLLLAPALTACGPLRSDRAAQDTHAEASQYWTESTEADFRLGTLEGLEIRRAGDGEIALARNPDGSLMPNGVYTSAPHSAPALFTAVTWQWDALAPSGGSIALQMRLSSDTINWSDWTEVRADEDSRDGDAAWQGHLLTTVPSSTVQYRVLLSAGQSTTGPELRSIKFTFIDAQPGPNVQQASEMVTPAGVGPGVKKPAIIPRKGWGANESLMTWEPEYETPRKVIIHHTDTPNDGQDPAAMVRAVYYYHAVTRQWGDIGYNYLIDYLGNIYEGRAGGEGVVGGHAHDFNRGSVGIALIGSFQDRDIPAAVQAATVKLVAWLCDHHGIDPRESSYFVDRDLMNVSGHRDSNMTTCPGDRGYAWMPDLRRRVWETMQSVEPSVAFLAPEENAVLSGANTVRARGNAAVSEITLFLDGSQVAKSKSSSLDWPWDTTAAKPGDHQLRVTARNASAQEASVVRMVLVDNKPPTGSVAVADSRMIVATHMVTLALTANDVGSGVAWMQVALGDDASSAQAQAYQSSLLLDLGSAESWVTVSAKFGDRAGLWSPVYKVTVFVDTVAPGDWRGMGVISETATVLVSDMGSGLDLKTARFATSTDGGATWSEPIPCQARGDEARAVLEAPVSEGISAVRFAISDAAGNVATSPVAFVHRPDEPVVTPTPSPPPPLAPDLTVVRLEIIPPEPEPGQPVLVRVTVRNQGGATETGSWVQLFVDPDTPPRTNSISSVVGKGLFWYIDGLGEGEEIVLINATAYSEYSNWNGELASGLHSIYAMVDSYNVSGDLGLIIEADESNNLSGPVQVRVGATGGLDWWPGLSQWLRRWFGKD